MLGDGLVVVFWASLVVAAESPRVAVGHPVRARVCECDDQNFSKI